MSEMLPEELRHTSTMFSSEQEACRQANIRAWQDHQVALARRNGVPQLELVDDHPGVVMQVPGPVAVPLAEARARYLASVAEVDRTAGWLKSALATFNAAEARLNGFSDLKSELQNHRRTATKTGQPVEIPESLRRTQAARSEVEIEFDLAKADHQHFVAEHAKAQQSMELAKIVLRHAVGIEMAGTQVKELVGQLSAALDDVDAIRLKLLGLPGDLGSVEQMAGVRGALLRTLGEPTFTQQQLQRGAWEAERAKIIALDGTKNE